MGLVSKLIFLTELWKYIGLCLKYIWKIPSLSSSTSSFHIISTAIGPYNYSDYIFLATLKKYAHDNGKISHGTI